MADPAHVQPAPGSGVLMANLTHFARALRKAGVNVGPGDVVAAVMAVEQVGLSSRVDFYHALKAALVRKPEDSELYAQVFRLFWRDPKFLDHMMSMLLPAVHGLQEERAPKPAERRAAEGLLGETAARASSANASSQEADIIFDFSQTASEEERLRHLDFEQMSSDEMRKANALLARLKIPFRPIMARRSRPGNGSQIDLRSALRQAARRGGEFAKLPTKRRLNVAPNIVVLCDISGSMSSYARAVLQLVHHLNKQPKPVGGRGFARGIGIVHAFTFGTQLTNITKALQRRDIDAALAEAGKAAQDWDGGTRIAACLEIFNKRWSRRVLAGATTVILVTDGLERGPPEELARQMKRLSLTARNIIWLNPLLRYENFSPKARGIQAILPYVSSFRAGHNIAALEGLVEALATPEAPGEKAHMMALLAGQGGK